MAEIKEVDFPLNTSATQYQHCLAYFMDDAAWKGFKGQIRNRNFQEGLINADAVLVRQFKAQINGILNKGRKLVQILVQNLEFINYL